MPDWIETERARGELALMTPQERAASPAPIPMQEVAGVVVAFVSDDALAGRVIVLLGGEPARLLDPVEG